MANRNQRFVSILGYSFMGTHAYGSLSKIEPISVIRAMLPTGEQ